MTAMNTAKNNKLFDMSHAVSLLCVFVLGFVALNGPLTPFIAMIALAFLGVAVMSAVHHAEVIATRIGPGLGALLLALSVTVIEVGLIVSLMMNDTPDSTVVARDTVFSAVIIVTNGILGVCLLSGGLRYRELGFNASGTSSLLAVLAILSGLTMVLPNFTTSTAGPTYNSSQLIFAAIASLTLYFSLVYAQTRSHKDYFESPIEEDTASSPHERPSRRHAIISFIGLILSLVVVIGLAKALSPSIEAGVSALGAPRATVGIIIALLVLLPETWAAISAARINQLQTSLNLALGSGAASIALTIPVVSVFSIMTHRQLTLGLDGKGIAFLVLTFLTAGFTLGSGRTTALHGIAHLVLMFAYVAFAFIP